MRCSGVTPRANFHGLNSEARQIVQSFLESFRCQNNRKNADFHFAAKLGITWPSDNQKGNVAGQTGLRPHVILAFCSSNSRQLWTQLLRISSLLATGKRPGMWKAATRVISTARSQNTVSFRHKPWRS